jgi:hypothetical protein
MQHFQNQIFFKGKILLFLIKLTDNLWSWWVYFKHKHSFQILFLGPEVFFFFLPLWAPRVQSIAKKHPRDNPLVMMVSHRVASIAGHNRRWINQSILIVWIDTFGLIFIDVIDPSVKDFLILIDSIDNQ